MTFDIDGTQILIALLVICLMVMSGRMGRQQNRIRRLEREVGLDVLPPNELDQEPEFDEVNTRVVDRVQRIESHLVL